MDKKWLSGLIREIQGMPNGIEAAVCLDTDNDKALMIRDRDERFCQHFNINWLVHDDRQVNWLAYVVGSALLRAYNQGEIDERKRTNKALSGFKGLLENIN